MCVRAEKNSELTKAFKMNLLEKRALKTLTIFAITFTLDVGFNSKTSKMKLLEKTVKIFTKALPIFAITFILDLGV